MKKLVMITLLAAMLLATATSALAAQDEPALRQPKPRPFALTGTIAAIDGAMVTVKVVGGNHLVKPYLGKNLALKTTASTRFLRKNPDGTVTPITLADLAVGQKVSVNGRLIGGEYVAQRITVGARLVHLP